MRVRATFGKKCVPVLELTSLFRNAVKLLLICITAAQYLANRQTVSLIICGKVSRYLGTNRLAKYLATDKGTGFVGCQI